MNVGERYELHGIGVVEVCDVSLMPHQVRVTAQRDDYDPKKVSQWKPSDLRAIAWPTVIPTLGRYAP